MSSTIDIRSEQYGHAKKYSIYAQANRLAHQFAAQPGADPRPRRRRLLAARRRASSWRQSCTERSAATVATSRTPVTEAPGISVTPEGFVNPSSSGTAGRKHEAADHIPGLDLNFHPVSKTGASHQ